MPGRDAVDNLEQEEGTDGRCRTESHAEAGLPTFPHGDGQADADGELRDPEGRESVKQGAPVEAGGKGEQEGYEGGSGGEDRGADPEELPRSEA
jgi:hypothetical protein